MDIVSPKLPQQPRPSPALYKCLIGRKYFWFGMVFLGLIGLIKPLRALADIQNLSSCSVGPGTSPDQTIQTCTQLIENNPGGPSRQMAEIYFVRGYAYFEKQDPAHAISDFSKAISLNPGLPEAYRGRGLVQLNEHSYDLAITDLSTAIRLRPEYVDALYNRGMAFLGKKELAASEADFDAAERLAPTNTSVAYLHAVTLRELGRFDQAILEFSRVIDQRPPVNYELALTGRGKALSASGDDVRAAADFETCIREFPSFADCYDQRGLIREKHDQDSDALADFDRAIDLNPGVSHYFADRAALEGRTGQVSEAAKDIARAQALAGTE